MLSFFVTLLLTLVTLAPLAAAQTIERDFALPGDAVCPIDLPEPGPSGNWTDAERWAWDQVCRGQWANMSLAGPGGYDGLPCNPAEIETKVPAHRALRPEFLQLILTRARWAEALAKPQVNIQCAQLESKLDLENAQINPELYLASSHLPAGANLLGAHFDRTLSFQGSIFKGSFEASGMSVGGDLFLRDGALFRQVNLKGAKVVGNVEADNSTLETDSKLYE